MNPKLDDAAVERRIIFLLNEASQARPVRDQSVTFTLRAIGNFLAVGKDCQSHFLTLNCRYRSRKAHEAYCALGNSPSAEARSAWRKEMINEHQDPLADVWKWMVENRGLLDPERVLARLKQWPVVVVTRDENRMLQHFAKLKHGPTPEPAMRYREAGIEVLERSNAGGNARWLPRCG